MTPLQAATLALAAYTDPPTYGPASGSGRAVVYGSDVAFPGTDNVACWLADLDCLLVPTRGMGTVHAGFWGALQTLAPKLAGLRPVNLVGHSEGAALALLYGAALCLAGTPPACVFAFEPPRISVDGAIAALYAHYAVPMLLTQHGNDVVPLVPRLLHAWQHPAPLTRFALPSEPLPNVADHYMQRVLASIAAGGGVDLSPRAASHTP